VVKLLLVVAVLAGQSLQVVLHCIHPQMQIHCQLWGLGQLEQKQRAQLLQVWQ
jgi:hypothetical protein